MRFGKSRQACFSPLVYEENEDEMTRSSRSTVLGYMVSWNNLFNPLATDTTSFLFCFAVKVVYLSNILGVW